MSLTKPHPLRRQSAPHLGPSNDLPFSGLGAAKPVPRFYADASAATRSAATAFDGRMGLAERDPAHLDGRFDIREVARFLLKFFVLRPEGGLK